jgi:hypothetical protein
MFIESSANVSCWSSGGAKYLIADAAPNGAEGLMLSGGYKHFGPNGP